MQAEIAVRGEIVDQSAATAPLPESATPAPSEAVSITPPASRAASSARARFAPLLPWISAAWMLGVALLTVRHFVGWQRLRGMRRGGWKARPELQRAFTRLLGKFCRTAGVRLLESAEAAVPMLAGFFKPAVLLPLRVISGLSEREIEAILAHELAHLVRRDAWSNLAQVAIETLFFYHPAMWWIGRCARQERENAADDLALEVCADRRVYAGALAQLAELRLDSRSALAATGGSLLARIQRIVRPAQVESPAGGWSLDIPALLTALAFAAAFQVGAQDTKPTPAAIVSVISSDEKELVPRATRDAQPWIDDMLQINDWPRRSKAIERVRQAIHSDAPESRLAGLIAYDQVRSAKGKEGTSHMIKFAGLSIFDPEDDVPSAFGPSRERFIELFKAAEPEVRAGAARCFRHCDERLYDLDVYLGLAADSSEEVCDIARGYFSAAEKREGTGGAGVFALPSHASTLKALLSKPSMTGDLRGSLEAILARCEKQPAVAARAVDLIGHPLFVPVFDNKAEVSFSWILNAKELATTPFRTSLHISADGTVRWDGKAQLFPELTERLKSTVEREPDHSVVISCDKETDYKFFKQIIETCQEAKVAKIAITAGEPAPSAAPASPAASVEKAEIEVEWKGNWWPETVLKKDGEKTRIHYVGYGAEWDEWVTAERIRPLDAAAAKEEKAPTEAGRVTQMVEKNRQAARLRAVEDQQRYTSEQLGEIEMLYQVANTKGKRSPEAKESLKTLLEKYDRANRTGCATLYLGQASEGAERLEYLTRAVEKFSDCYYFNGCQVGGYGRYVLSLTLWEKGDREKARARFAELKTTYQEATDHRGRPMSEAVEAAEKELAGKE